MEDALLDTDMFCRRQRGSVWFKLGQKSSTALCDKGTSPYIMSSLGHYCATLKINTHIPPFPIQIFSIICSGILIFSLTGCVWDFSKLNYGCNYHFYPKMLSFFQHKCPFLLQLEAVIREVERYLYIFRNHDSTKQLHYWSNLFPCALRMNTAISIHGSESFISLQWNAEVNVGFYLPCVFPCHQHRSLDFYFILQIWYLLVSRQSSKIWAKHSD